MADVIAFFQNCGRSISAFGIGSFGPIDLNPASSTYGFITSTPKESWQNFDLAGTIQRAFNVPVAFDTDVNAAILAESQWGAAQGLETALYVTVGTGIGGGAIVGGKPLHGLVHPEMGHIRIPHDFARDPFPVSVLITAIAWKVLHQGLPSKRDGGLRLQNFLLAILHLTLKLTIWRLLA